MHAAVAALLRRPDPRTPLSAAEARELLALTPEHTLDLLAAARLAASTAGRVPFTCGIVNAKSGRCAENCAFCAQSAHHHTNAPDYPLLGTDALLRKAENEGDYTSRLALQEEVKSLPFSAVWDAYCAKQNVPVGDEWLKIVKQYEKDVMSKR